MNLKKSQSAQTENEEFGLAKSLALSIGIFIAVLLAVWLVSQALGFTIEHHEADLDDTYTAIATIISSFTIILLIYLLAKYIEVFMLARSGFTFGLILLVLAVIANSITANPLFHLSLGFTPMQGPFVFVPLLFTLLTVIVLLYLAHE